MSRCDGSGDGRNFEKGAGKSDEPPCALKTAKHQRKQRALADGSTAGVPCEAAGLRIQAPREPKIHS